MDRSREGCEGKSEKEKERDSIRIYLKMMLEDFQNNRLVVVLAEADEQVNIGAKKRVVISRNVKWYRDLCASYPSNRRKNKKHPDTIVRRINIDRVLTRLVLNKATISKYAQDLLDIAEQMMWEMQTYEYRDEVPCWSCD